MLRHNAARRNLLTIENLTKNNTINNYFIQACGSEFDLNEYWVETRFYKCTLLFGMQYNKRTLHGAQAYIWGKQGVIDKRGDSFI